MPKQHRSRATFDALLRATGELVVSEGFATTSTNRIADHAEVSVGSLYQYFADKETMLSARLDMMCDEAVKTIEARTREVQHVQYPRAIRAIFDALDEAYRADVALRRAVAEQAYFLLNPTHLDRVVEAVASLYRVLLERADDALNIPPETKASYARLAASVTESTIRRHVLSSGDDDEPSRAVDVVNLRHAVGRRFGVDV